MPIFTDEETMAQRGSAVVTYLGNGSNPRSCWFLTTVQYCLKEKSWVALYRFLQFLVPHEIKKKNFVHVSDCMVLSAARLLLKLGWRMEGFFWSFFFFWWLLGVDLEDPGFSGLYRFLWDAETVVLLTRMSRVSKPRNHVWVKMV